MSIVRFSTGVNGFAPATFNSLIDRFFNETLTRRGGSQYSFAPRADIIENEKGFEILIAVPGMRKEDFTIDVNENVLSVSGERKFARERKENYYVSIESQYGNFKRSFTLPESVDAGKITASYVNGVLEISLPKDEKKTQKTTISVD